MTARVDFHILHGGWKNQPLRYTCRLIRKAWDQGLSIQVCCVDDATAATLDEQLWMFEQEAFIPHDREKGTPVYIVENQTVIRSYDLVINLLQANCLAVDMNQDINRRFVEIVLEESADIARARQRYRQYRDWGCELHYHTIGEVKK